MNKFAIATTIAGILAAGAMAMPGAAIAAPTGGSNAGDAVKDLRDMGYNVQLNGTVRGPLSQCTVTDVPGLANNDPTVFTTAYVDISWPSSDD